MVVLAMWLCSARAAHAQLLSPGPLSRAHAELEGDGKCQRCHVSGAQIAEPRCFDCHKDIGNQRQKGLGLHGGPFRGERCGSCHVEHVGKDAALIRWPGPDPKRFDHTKTGWPLRGAHVKTACRECHDRKNERGAPTFLGADRRCVSCHEDPHEKRYGERCNDCHNETSFKQLDLDTFNHDLARFKLEGAHTQVACAECHREPPRYKGLAFSDCSSCHEDPHRGKLEGACKTCHVADAWTSIVMPRAQHPGLSLAAGHQPTPCRSCHDAGLTAEPTKGSTCVSCHAEVHDAPFGSDCKQCHASIKWTGLSESIGKRAHARTPFPLRGQHGRVDCAECHLPTLPPDARYRELSFGKCADCHKDVHKGTLREHGDCAKCHDPLGFAPSLVDPTIHAKFRMPLEGSHAATACSACHKIASTPRLSWSTSESQCHDCHQNPHGTQFATEMLQGGCAHCHAPAGWGLAKVDHSTWPLTGAHATAACSGCHTPTTAGPKQRTAISYRGVPRDCDGCHDDTHAGQFRLSEPVRACDACHQTERFALPDFDHHARTDYPLEGKHREATCAACHPGVKLASGEEVTRYRLGYSQCSDCHADPHSIPAAVVR